MSAVLGATLAHKELMLTEREKKIVVDLIAIAWQAGAVRGEEQAAELKGLKLKMLEEKKAD